MLEAAEDEGHQKLRRCSSVLAFDIVGVRRDRGACGAWNDSSRIADDAAVGRRLL